MAIDWGGGVEGGGIGDGDTLGETYDRDMEGYNTIGIVYVKSLMFCNLFKYNHFINFELTLKNSISILHFLENC